MNPHAREGSAVGRPNLNRRLRGPNDRPFSISSAGPAQDVSVRLLLISDDRNAADLLAACLRHEYFIVHTCDIGRVGSMQTVRNSYDLVLLERILPETDCSQICRDFRAHGIATPILVLGAHDTIDERVAGLNSGADDYLSTPFAFAELVARIHALLRRSYSTRPPELSQAHVTVDSIIQTEPDR